MKSVIIVGTDNLYNIRAARLVFQPITTLDEIHSYHLIRRNKHFHLYVRVMGIQSN